MLQDSSLLELSRKVVKDPFGLELCLGPRSWNIRGTWILVMAQRGKILVAVVAVLFSPILV